MNPFAIKTDAFEGPLELLLSLVEERKLLINDIALSSVADDFIRYIKEQERLPAGEIADFLVVASTLLLIKSRSLLPSLALTEEEKIDAGELERRLKALQLVKRTAMALKNEFGARYAYPRGEIKRVPIFAPGKELSVQLLSRAIKAVIAGIPRVELLPKVAVRKIISLEEMMEKLAERVKKAINTSFKEFAGFGKKEKKEIIVGFLAVLELIKRGMIEASQETDGDFRITSVSTDIPRYA